MDLKRLGKSADMILFAAPAIVTGSIANGCNLLENSSQHKALKAVGWGFNKVFVIMTAFFGLAPLVWSLFKTCIFNLICAATQNRFEKLNNITKFSNDQLNNAFFGYCIALILLKDVNLAMFAGMSLGSTYNRVEHLLKNEIGGVYERNGKRILSYFEEQAPATALPVAKPVSPVTPVKKDKDDSSVPSSSHGPAAVPAQPAPVNDKTGDGEKEGETPSTTAAAASSATPKVEDKPKEDAPSADIEVE